MKHKKILIITSSGGGGLLQAAVAKEQEARALDPTVVMTKRDLLKDWVWTPIGMFFIAFWNISQRRGSVAAQRLCVWGQFIIDFLLHPVVFVYAYHTLCKEDIDHVIDTQPLGTSAILKALNVYNRKRNKSVRLEKIMVDLPTTKATHFCGSIKKLSPKYRKLLTLSSIAPLLDTGESAEQFWQKMCGLSADEINLTDVCVRQAFWQYRGKARTTAPMQAKIRCKSEEEKGCLLASLQKGSIQAKEIREGIELTVEPDGFMVTILLGSQPSKGATFTYVKNWIEVAKEHPLRKIILFVFCADHKVGGDSLLKKVSQLVADFPNYPNNLSVIPFSFQTDDVIAPLFFRSDITCTRSGGGTAMELICVSKGAIWIHSEAKASQPLLSGIPGWEAESAVYLQRLHQAKIVTPETFRPLANSVLARPSFCC